MGVKEAYRKSRFPLERVPPYIIDRQNNLLRQSPKVSESVLSNGANFFTWYGMRNDFKEACERAHEILSASSYELEHLINLFAGKIFEDIASIYLSREAKVHPERTVISGENTLLFFEDLYPNSWKIRYPYPFNIDSLNDHSVPDGLIVDGSGVITICEYTLMEDKLYFKDKYRKFKSLKKKFPKIFGRSDFLFVVPRTSSDIMRGIQENVGGNNTVRFLELPFSRLDFRQFFERTGVYDIGGNIPGGNGARH